MFAVLSLKRNRIVEIRIGGGGGLFGWLIEQRRRSRGLGASLARRSAKRQNRFRKNRSADLHLATVARLPELKSRFALRAQCIAGAEPEQFALRGLREGRYLPELGSIAAFDLDHC